MLQMKRIQMKEVTEKGRKKDMLSKGSQLTSTKFIVVITGEQIRFENMNLIEFVQFQINFFSKSKNNSMERQPWF